MLQVQVWEGEMPEVVTAGQIRQAEALKGHAHFMEMKDAVEQMLAKDRSFRWNHAAALRELAAPIVRSHGRCVGRLLERPSIKLSCDISMTMIAGRCSAAGVMEPTDRDCV